MPDDGASNAGDGAQPAHRLDDEADREELRERYYGLIQELRVMLPGVQVLVAFLLTVPFSQRFADLDDFGRTLFGFTLVFAMLSAAAFISPAAMHRFGPRTARSVRLGYSIWMLRVGLVCLATSLVLALAVVARFLYADAVTYALVIFMAVVLATLWIVIPLATRRAHIEDE